MSWHDDGGAGWDALLRAQAYDRRLARWRALPWHKRLWYTLTLRGMYR